jgi:hypothetical protein
MTSPAALLANMSIKHPLCGARGKEVAMKRLGFLIGMLTFTAVAGGVLMASHAEARATTETIHVTNVTESNPDVNPCSEATGTFSQTYSGVFHSTVLPNGTSWFTGTLHGTVSFVPDDSTQPSYAGRFTTWFGDENNLQNEVEHATFRAKLLGTDGSVVMAHETAHMGTSASGLSFSFDKARFTCR